VKDYQGAIADFDQSIRFDPNDTSPYNNRAFARYHLGDREGALIDLQKAAQHAQAQGNQQLYERIMRDIRALQR
jgi:regulator of sirC expression with transglutaminase-like and TPR domain